MIQQVPIKCSCCGKMKPSLSFWKKLEEHDFYLCLECLEKPKTENTLLLIGFRHGTIEMQERLRKAVKRSGFLNEGASRSG